MTDDFNSQCSYVLREDGIYELTLTDYTIAGVDAYMTVLENIYKQRTDISKPLLMLLVGAGSLPLNYVFERGKELSARYPNLGKIYSATLTNHTVEARLADSFMRLIRFPGTQVRFFAMSHRDEAIEWLLAQN